MNNNVNVENTSRLIICPECREISDSIKQYTMIDYVVFLVFGAFGRRITYTCCPHCMRKHILMKGFTYNIITGNALWLLVILPWSLILLIMSTTQGHSKKVLQVLDKNN